MPLQILRVPANENHLYSAFSLGFLLPSLIDEEKIEDAIFCLFGKIYIRESNQLLTQLDGYSQEAYPASLNGLINNKLRPRIAKFIRDTPSQSFAAEPAALSAAAQAIEQGSPLFESIAIKAMALMTGTNIHVENTLENAKQSWTGGTGQANPAIYLVKIDNVYQYLFDLECLPESMRKNLSPFSKLTQTLDVDTYKRAKLKGELLKTMSNTPRYLCDISRHVPRQSIVPDAYSTRPSDLRDYMRFDALRESQIARLDSNKVNLTTSYDLCLKSESDSVILENRLYIDIGPTGFTYTARNSSKNNEIIPESENRFISYDSLEHKFKVDGPLTLEQLSLCLPKILQITSGRGHTKVCDAAFLYTKPTGIHLAKSLGASAITGSIADTGVTIFGWSLLPSAGLPGGVITFGLTLLGALYGKGFAVLYEKALDRASILVTQGQFEEAAKVLDDEFQRIDFNKAARGLFLTKHHYAVAHFLRAVCADLRGQWIDAYSHYEQASKHAVDADKKLTYLVSQLQLLKLLKNTSTQLPEKITDRDNEIMTRLKELGKHYADGFADAYWSLHNSMTKTAERLVTLYNLDEVDKKIANAFLVTDGFFTLKYFAAGYGPFLSLFGTFFQGAMLAFFKLENPNYLDEKVKSQLINEFGVVISEKDTLITKLASKKFYQCAYQLREFRHGEYKDLIKNNPVIQNSIAIIEMFILDFHLLSINDDTITLQNCFELAQLLSIENQQIDTVLERIESSVNFLIKLNGDFGLNFETLDQWLDAIITTDSMKNLISTSGDTMLHALAMLPIGETDEMTRRIQNAALLLKDLRHKPNHSKLTPLDVLQTSDPCLLFETLFPDVNIRPCALVSIPTTFELNQVLINQPFGAAYVRFTEDYDLGIFYITREDKTWLKLTKEQLAEFDAKLQPGEQIRLLLKEELTQITIISSHSHKLAEEKLGIEVDKCNIETQKLREIIAQKEAEKNAVSIERDRLRMTINHFETSHSSEETLCQNTDESVTETVERTPAEKSKKSIKGAFTNFTHSITQTFYGSSPNQNLSNDYKLGSAVLEKNNK